MIKIRTIYSCKVTYYSLEKFLEYCKNNEISISNLEVDNYTFYFNVTKKNYVKLKLFVNEIIIIKKYGLEKIYEITKLNKISIMLLVFSFCLYAGLNNRIYQITINGTNILLNDMIRQRIDELNISRYQLMPNNKELKELEKILKMEFIDYIDVISVNSKGTYIFINYAKKGEEVEIIEKHGKMYAKKDAIIKSFDIESGKIVKEINDYVKKGELIVDDTLYYNDKPIIVGTAGTVFGYTFNKISLSCISTGLEKSEIYQILLSKARYEITKNFQLGEYIEKEIILSYINQNEIANMTIHYTLVENIISFE